MHTPAPQTPTVAHPGAGGLSALVARHLEPLSDLDAAPLDALLERVGAARVVCIGEASHGTSEFYRLRARITRELIERGACGFVAVEADWPDAERLDAYVRHRFSAGGEWEAFARFPTWMWRNAEVCEFVEWLRDWNAGRDPGQRVGFFGLDVYSLFTSMREVLRYLGERDEVLAKAARERYGCLMRFADEPIDYGRALVSQDYRDCEDAVTAALDELLGQRLALMTVGGDGGGGGSATGTNAVVGKRGERDFGYFNAVQNARLVRDAEAYYRQMFYGEVSTWNLRDTHMMETLEALLAYFGPESRAVAWAHNSHLGDAAATYMGQRGEHNLGHLCRRAYGERTYLIGFGTHTGTVFAADDWDAPGRVKAVRPSRPDSYERVMHDTGTPAFALPLRTGPEALREALSTPRLERAIGVIYRPETERQSHYFTASLPYQFDEYLWINETSALRPLNDGDNGAEAPAIPRGHPFGLLDD